MYSIYRFSKSILSFILFINLIFTSKSTFSQNASQLKFEISFSGQAHAESITGRVYAIIARNNDREPHFQTGYTGVPIWGKNISALQPGESAIIDEKVFGYPLRSIKDIPPGEYFIQGFVNIYTEFRRSDGHTLWLHQDQWEGQQWNRSTGNLYSDVRKVKINPSIKQKIKLICTNVMPPLEIPPDTKWVKRFKIQSKILTEFWGQPMFLGATVLLPDGYDEHPELNYPVIYIQDHFSLSPPFGFRDEPPDTSRRWSRRGYEFYQFWTSDSCPRMIAVTFQHPCPYYDDSYAVNSPNIGPYQDAIMHELIPYIEQNFRIIRKPYSRVLTGGSTGGWISLALQIYQPDFFAGTWSLCPDPVDFRYYQIVNIYEDKNAYFTEHEWLRVERPNRRSTDGNIQIMMKDENYYELAIGDKSRSGGQWDIWGAAFGPIGEDGYPKPIWNKLTGEIDHEVAAYFKENFDLCFYLEKNWSWLGKKLVGKLHIYIGNMDSFYLNDAVVLLEEFLENTKDPYYAGVVKYGDRQPHCWGPRGAELIKLMAEYIIKNAPESEDTAKWRY